MTDAFQNPCWGFTWSLPRLVGFPPFPRIGHLGLAISYANPYLDAISYGQILWPQGRWDFRWACVARRAATRAPSPAYSASLSCMESMISVW